MEYRREAPEELRWEAAIRLFVKGWGADHLGVRQTGVHNVAMIYLMAFCGLRVAEPGLSPKNVPR